MTRTKTSWPSQAIKQLIPINQLITLLEEIFIPFDHLEIADLSNLPSGVSLVTFVGPSIKVRITKGTMLRVKVFYKISDDDSLAQKYGVEAVVRAMNQTTEVTSLGRGQTNQLPSLTGASWELPNKVTREFELPVKTTGAQLLAAVRSSDEFVISTAEMLLAHEAKMQADEAQS